MRQHMSVFDLGSILIKPVQRILKYPLLLNELIKVIICPIVMFLHAVLLMMFYTGKYCKFNHVLLTYLLSSFIIFTCIMCYYMSSNVTLFVDVL